MMDTSKDKQTDIENQDNPQLDKNDISPNGEEHPINSNKDSEVASSQESIHEKSEKTATDSAKSVSEDGKESIQQVHLDQGSEAKNIAQAQIGGNVINSNLNNVGRDLIKADVVNIINKFNTEEEKKTDDTNQLSITELKANFLQKVRAIFVPSQSYNSAQQHISSYEKHVFIVHGPEHAGKSTCAVHLGIKLCEDKHISPVKISLYKRTNRDSIKLLDFVQSSNLNNNTVCIIEDAFENGITKTELSEPYLSSLIDILKNKTANLIITTTLEAKQLAELDVEKIDAVVDDMPLVFKRHLDCYDRTIVSDYRPEYYLPESVIHISRKEHAKIEQFLKQPFQVDLFCRELSRLTPEDCVEEKILELAKWIGSIDQENPRAWFQKLSLNAKLYAMLVVLFDGIDRLTLDRIYIDAVQRLRNSGVKRLAEPRQIGLEDLLEGIRAQEDETHTIHFNSSDVREEILRQIFNYHHLLWSLMDMVVQLIDLYKDRDSWKLRSVLGIAVGRLGIYQKSKLISVLEILAKHQHGGVVAVVGYALDEMGRIGSEYYPFIITLLEKWVKSGDPDFMWAVAVSIERIYGRITTETEREGFGNELDINLSCNPKIFTSLCHLTSTKDSWQSERFLENATDSYNVLGSYFGVPNKDGQYTIAGAMKIGILLILTKLAKTFNQFSDKAQYQVFTEISKQTEQPEEEEIVTFQQFLHELSIRVKVAQKMQETLENWATDNLRAIVHAIHQIALTYPKDMVKLLVLWLQSEKGSNLYLSAQIAGEQLFQQNSHPDIQLFKERHLPLLGLVKPFLATIDNPINTMLRTLLGWCQKPGWAEEIHSKLLYIVNQATREEAAVLRESISREWLDKNDIPIEVRRIGQSVMARSYLMEGVPVTISNQGCGVIAIDASFDARMNYAAEIGRRLYERFDSQVDMYVVRMGEATSVATPVNPISSIALQTDHDRPRLICPPLETEPVSFSRVYFTVALTWDAITDIHDIEKEEDQECLIIVSSEEKPQYSDKITVIPVKRQVSEQHLVQIETIVRARFAGVITTLQSQEWWRTLQQYFSIKPLTKQTIDLKLHEWIKQLDDIQHAQPLNDVVRLIICTILWLASKDLSVCVEIVENLIAEEDELFHLMGAACGKTLFKVYAHRNPVPPIEPYARLLELAPLLGKHSWSGSETVFYALRRWVVQPEWFERVMNPPNGENSELLQVVESVLPEHYDVLSTLLKKWRNPLKLEHEETTPETVIKLAEQLELWVALKMRTQLPALPEGHHYGLIVIDASERNSDIRDFWAEITSNVIKQLIEHKHDKLELMVYRLGEDYPIVMPRQIPKAESLLPLNVKRPRLLYPIIETHLTENVSFILLLTNKPIIDQDDWLDTHWSERIELYIQRQEPSWAKSLAVIPAQEELENVVPIIVRYIEKKIGV